MKPSDLSRHLPSLLRAGVLAGAATVFCWPLTVASGVAAAVAGALGADALGRRQANLRLASVLGTAFLTLVIGTWLARTLAASPLLAGVLGPVATPSI